MKSFTFSQRQLNIVIALCERFFRSENPKDASPSQLNIAAKIDVWLAELSPNLQSLIKMDLWAINWFPILFVRRFRNFLQLTPQEQDCYLCKLEECRFLTLRTMFLALKTIFYLNFWDEEIPLREVGHDFASLLENRGRV